MPHTQIQWIKLERRLLNDYRFYIMSDNAQLLYIKLLLMAGETNNLIPKDIKILSLALRSRQTDEEILQAIEEVKTNFPKFKENGNKYYFEEFESKHNWVLRKYDQSSTEVEQKEVNPSYSSSYSYTLFNIIWAKYPNRTGRKQALLHFQSSVKNDNDWKNIQLALDNYKASDLVTKEGGKYIQNGKTWFNNWQDWITPPKVVDPWAKYEKKESR